MDGLSTSLKQQLHNPANVGHPLDEFLTAADDIPDVVATEGYARLKAFAEALGLRVTEDSPDSKQTASPATTGVTFFDLKTIWIRPTVSIQNKFQTLLHELAHVADLGRSAVDTMLRGDRHSVATGELVAESVVWVVNQRKGWSTKRSEFYLGSNFRDFPADWLDGWLDRLAPDITGIAADLVAVVDGEGEKLLLQAA